VPILTKTLKDAGFDGIFTEVEHTATLGLRNPNELRMFHLAVQNNAFSFSALSDFVMNNIGQYVYSRARIDKFHTDDTVATIALKALAQLRESSGGDDSWIGNELGDVLLYIFLEQILGAPKLFSKFELSVTEGQNAVSNGSVHMLALDGGVPAYQMVFGKSRICGDLQNAVDDAFITIEAIRSDATSDVRLVESTAFSQLYELETADYLKNIILPRRDDPATIAPSLDRAFGVFLGYSLGLIPENYSNAEFPAAMQQKMNTDIQNHVAYIAEKIRTTNLGTHSFYFYILPFNDADGDKHGIMSALLEGRDMR